jgi:hypothetical protein
MRIYRSTTPRRIGLHRRTCGPSGGAPPRAPVEGMDATQEGSSCGGLFKAAQTTLNCPRFLEPPRSTVSIAHSRFWLTRWLWTRYPNFISIDMSVPPFPHGARQQWRRCASPRTTVRPTAAESPHRRSRLTGSDALRQTHRCIRISARSGNTFQQVASRPRCRDTFTRTSSPTRKPPVSSAAFHTRPNSLRSIVISVSNASFSLPHGSLAAPR